MLSSSQFNFPSNYFSVWSGTAPRPIPSSSSSSSTTFTPSRMPNLPPLPSSDSSSSSSSSTSVPAAPLSRYAQLVQAKMRNTSLASTASSSSSTSWTVTPSSKASISSNQAQPGVWSNLTPGGGPRKDQMGDQLLLDFQQGPNVCNSSFIGHNKQETNFGLGSTSSGFGGGLSGIASELQSDLVAEERSFQMVAGSRQEHESDSRGVSASPASTSSQSSARRGDKRKAHPGETEDEQRDDGLWGGRRHSVQPSPSGSFPSSLPPDPPFHFSNPNPSTSSSSSFSGSDWFPSSSSSTSILPSSYLPSSTPSSMESQNPLAYHTSSYQPGTGYGALPTPTVGRYPSTSTEDAAWWRRINLTSNDPPPELDASFVRSVFGPAVGGSCSGQSSFGRNQESAAGGPSSEDRYSYVALATSRQDSRSTSGTGELSRYQQLMAAKYGGLNSSMPYAVSHPSTSLTPGFQPTTLASTSPPSPALNAHLASVSPLEYSQYPISSNSTLYPVETTNYSQSTSSSSSQDQPFPIPQPSSASSSFPSYFSGSSTASYSQGLGGGYHLSGGDDGGVGSSGWTSKPFQDASQSRESNRSNSWGNAESSSSSSSSSNSSSSVAPPYTNPLPLLHLPPTPTLSTSHRSPQPPTPTPSTLTVAALPSPLKAQPNDSLLLPMVLAGRPLVPILPRPPPPPAPAHAPAPTPTTTPSSSTSLTPPSPLLPLIAISSLPSPSLSIQSLAIPNPMNSSSSSSPTASSSMPPPSIPLPKSTVGPPSVPSFNVEEWESIAPSGGAPKKRGQPRAKKVKQEQPSPEEIGSEGEEREGSTSSTSGKGEDNKKKLMLACHFCRGRKLK